MGPGGNRRRPGVTPRGIIGKVARAKTEKSSEKLLVELPEKFLVKILEVITLELLQKSHRTFTDILGEARFLESEIFCSSQCNSYSILVEISGEIFDAIGWGTFDEPPRQNPMGTTERIPGETYRIGETAKEIHSII